MKKGNDSKPIRIAMIMGRWIGGGVESVIMNYYRHIDRNKIQFDFICDDISTDIPYEEIEKLGGRVILCPSYTKIFKYQKFLIKLFEKEKYKIIHSNINSLSIFPLRAAYKAGVPIRIAHSHSTSNKKEWKKNLIKNILRPFSKKYANTYFACSELAGRWLFGDKTFDEGKVTIINNAIDLGKFKYNKDIRTKLRKKLKIKDSTLVIGHIGRFVKQKNHEYLIDIFNEVHKKNKDSILLLIGQGPLKESIENKVKELNLTDSVIFTGQVNNASDYYNAMDIFLLPSLYEGLGMVLVEAQANGLHCIASTEVPNIANVGGLVNFIDLNDKDKFVKEVMNTDIKRVECIKKIRNNGYDINEESKKMEKIYLDNSKVKVCHVVSGLRGGGVESMIYNYCSRMDSNKIKFYLLYQHEPSKKNIDEFHKIGFELKRIPSKIKHPIKNYKETYNCLKNNNIEVVHCHMTLMNFIPLIAARKLKIKVRICHSHNSDVRKKNIIKKVIENLLKHLCIKNATILVACGEDAGKYLYGNHKFMIIPNAIDLNKFKFDSKKREKIRRKYNITDDDILIGHIGRFTDQKNHEFLINIFYELYKKNQHYRLILLGDGENKEKITKKINAINLNNYIIMPGIVENPNYYYNAMDIFVLPSLWEGLPVVAIEAQANGLYCIFSDNVSREAKLTKNCEFLPINDINIWTGKILKAKNTKHIYNNSSLELYNINSQVIKLYNLYTNSLSEVYNNE